MQIKILVNTPKNQAAKAIETQKKMMLGITKAHLVVKQKLINDTQFYWILEIANSDEYIKIAKKCANAEVFIKKFYYNLIRMIDRMNKLASKFKKGADWMRRWLIWNLKKKYKEQHTDENGFISQFESMSDSEFKEFIEISDRKAMEKLLAGPLIVIEDWPLGDLE